MSTDNKPTVQQAAKQGNPKAIEAIFNKQLQHKNIVTKAILRDGCLQIMLEAKQELQKASMVTGIKKILAIINPENIESIKVYFKQSGDDFPKWQEDFELIENKKDEGFPNIKLSQPDVPKLTESINSNDKIRKLTEEKTILPKLSDSSNVSAKSGVNQVTNNPNLSDSDVLLIEKARWGDLDSISILLNSTLKSQGASVRINSPKVKFLEIVLESKELLDKLTTIETIRQCLNKTNTRAFNQVGSSGFKGINV